jgi:hypothetical protein
MHYAPSSWDQVSLQQLIRLFYKWEYNEFMTMFYIQATRKIYSETFFKSIWNAIEYFYKLFAAWIKKIG